MVGMVGIPITYGWYTYYLMVGIPITYGWYGWYTIPTIPRGTIYNG